MRFTIAVAVLALIAAAPAAATDLVLDGVTIVDTANGKLMPGMAISITDGRIERIARAGTIRIAPGIRRIAARGKFVTPGFLDMHAHVLDSSDPAGNLALMLSYGITGFRQMSGSPGLLQARAAGTLPLSDATPALLAMPGTILTPANAATPEQAVAEVDRQKAQGADFIKVVAASPAGFRAALAEAKRVGLPFAGHLPPTVPVLDAARAGMRSIEHEGPTESILLSCSSDEAQLRADLPRPVPPAGPPAGPPPALAMRSLVNPVAVTAPAIFAHTARMLASFDETRCRALAADLAVTGSWQVPTLLRLRTMEFGDAAEYRGDPSLRFVTAEQHALWQDVSLDFERHMTPEVRATMRRLFAAQLRLAKLLDDAHVPLLAGTDFGGGWIVPGVSLHQEFALLQEAGLSPLTILQMTTLNGARFLGREATMGSVAVGKNADLVLLDADPIRDVRALDRIAAVVRAGRYFSAADLKAMQDAAVKH